MMKRSNKITRKELSMTAYRKNILKLAKMEEIWDVERNELPFETLLFNPEHAVHWLCEKGHRWKNSFKTQYELGIACPTCTGYKRNNLKAIAPHIANEWHPTKNENISLLYINHEVKELFWWQCEHGHEWQATPKQQLTRKHRCPYCSDKKLWSGFNDLKTRYPKLAQQWHPTKNGNLTPEKLLPKDKRIIYWQCQHGHEFSYSTPYFIRLNGECPTCKKTLSNFNPELAAQWHPTKNGDLTPDDVTSSSDLKVWWLAPCGHEWQTKISSRVYKTDLSCTVCQRLESMQYASQHREILTHKRLHLTHPELAKRWHPTLNGDLTPDQVFHSYQLKVWWLGDCGHEWEESIVRLVHKKTWAKKCPDCLEQEKAKKEGSLADQFPELVKEWHPTKNLLLSPHSVYPFSHRKVWWQCKNGHEWETTLHLRCAFKKNCPYCH